MNLPFRDTTVPVPCRARPRRFLLAAWRRDEKAGFAACRKAGDASGIDAPDTEALAWGEVMTSEESDARDHVAVSLERAEQVERRELLVGPAELAAEAGWHDRLSGRSPTPEELGRFVFPLLSVLETFGLHVEHDVPRQGWFDRLTDDGRATALEALRVRATGPQHRLLD